MTIECGAVQEGMALLVTLCLFYIQFLIQSNHIRVHCQSQFFNYIILNYKYYARPFRTERTFL